jgi:hypothetical protein
MAKRKPLPAKAAEAVPEGTGKVRFEVRFDQDVYESIKSLADGAQISVNQLMHALARWAGQNGQLGEPSWDDGGRLRSRDQPGCLWFGRPARHMSSEELRDEAGAEGKQPEEIDPWIPGKLVFALDFTERRVLREEESHQPSR